MKPAVTVALFVTCLVMLISAALLTVAAPRASAPATATLPPPVVTPTPAPEPEPAPGVGARLLGTWRLDHVIDEQQTTHTMSGIFEGIQITFAPTGGMTLRLPKSIGGTGQSISANYALLSSDADRATLQITDMEVAHGQAPPQLYPSQPGAEQRVDVTVQGDTLTLKMQGAKPQLVFTR